MTRPAVALLCLLPLVGFGGAAVAMDPADVPAAAPNDAIMASPAEVAQMAAWAAAAFTGVKPPAPPADVRLELRRQDHNVLRFNRSILTTPLQIGTRRFARGLGTHANSEIAVFLPPGAKAFKAFVGVDNNPDTAGRHGTVQFSVEIAGKEVARTTTLRGGGEPVAVEVAIPKGTEQLVLKVDATADGTGWDHADWAQAHLVMDDGTVRWLDGNQPSAPLLGPAAPFSFTYGGTPSSELLNVWPRTVETKDLKDRTEHRVTWSDPKTALAVTAVVGVFKRYPAVEWVLYFENRGQADTPILADIQALDAQLATGAAADKTVVHQLRGDDCSEGSFRPFETALAAGGSLRIAPVGGRSSNGAFPFFNVECGGQGIVTAIGWSGQWAATFDRPQAGPTHLKAGMEKTHLRLHAGERIRSPRILLMAWTGDRLAAHNRFRRLMLFHYVPQQNGKPAAMPVFWQGYDRYRTHPKWGNEAGQIHAAEVARQVGCDVLWLDAAWFPGDFPNGVGNWTCKPVEFPNGLKPVSDACHRLGLKFIVWFEPERVAAGSQIAREHPEFVFGGEKGGLFKLSDPAAREWLTDLLSTRITEFGMDWYRNDFNIDPLPFWRAADEPDRQGMTEIRYVEGHYAMWDELRRRHPGLLIDNCASGGRRIDLETCMRSMPLWQSDTACVPGHVEWNQAQTCGLGLYIPFHEACGWSSEAYDFRSAAAAGGITQFGFLDDGFDLDAAKAAVAEARENQKYWYGDFYPLTPCSTRADEFVAWQMHRADLGAGLVLAFRRTECNVLGVSVGLGGLDPDATYRVEFIDEARRATVKTMRGRDMATDFPLLIPARRASLLVRYRQVRDEDR